MAYGIVHRFAGGTEDQYRASLAAVHPSDGSLPEGQVFHVAGPSDDGWVIVGGSRNVEHLALRDRKSTRLNSSHANISYAVFCLKKKKNQLVALESDHEAASQ